jgi:hypothetical protein
MSSTSKCRSGCRTQDHASWGECAQAANFSIGDAGKQRQMKNSENELNAYKDARKAGIQPASTKMADVQKAVRMSDKVGTAVTL